MRYSILFERNAKQNDKCSYYKSGERIDYVHNKRGISIEVKYICTWMDGMWKNGTIESLYGRN